MARAASPAGQLSGAPAARMRASVWTGPSDRLIPRNSDQAVAVRLEQRLPLGVVRAGDRVVVPGPTIGLHHEALARPAE